MNAPRVLLVVFAALLASAAAARAGDVQTGSDYDPLHESLGSLPPFKLKDQNGNFVEREQLLGKVCIVSFFFSCCTSVCPKTQTTMAELQGKFKGWSDVLLVSINVFSGHDDEAILQQYARDHGAEPGRWLFLHGSEEEIKELVQGGFKQGMARNPSAPPGYEVDHTPNFMIVDHRGTIRGYADGLKPDEVRRLETFVKQLVQAKYLPTINAALNGTCGVLLVLGYALIRRRWLTAHKAVMLAALGVSAVFLGCYLYYHFAVLDGRPTRFSGEGAVRYTYLGILLSHTLLAVAVAPLALRVTYLGLRDRLAAHMFLARITLPLWIYVSITGVVVYVMLYHLYPPV
jgi:protein SCO1/2/putative membrane protein